MSHPNNFYPSVNLDLEPNVFEFLRNRCNRFKDRIALVENISGREWSFSTVLSRVCQLREFLRTEGICPGDHVALYCYNSLESYSSVFALAALSAVTVLIRPVFKSREVNTILDLSKCTAIITDDAHLTTVLDMRGGLQSLRTIILIGDAETPFPNITKLFLEDSSKSSLDDPGGMESQDLLEDTVFMLPTSGTSGQTKLVQHTHRSFMSSFHITTPYVKILRQEDVVLMSASMSHVTGLWTLGGCLHTGAKCVLPKLVKVPSFETFRSNCHRHGVTTVLISPIVTRGILLNATGEPILSVTNLLCGGSRPSSSLESLLRQWFPNIRHIRHLLGQTELMVYISITPENEFDLQTVGYPPSNCEIRILDVDTGEEAGVGELGEIVVSSPCVMKGYFKDPEGTQAVFTGDGWLKTGDLGYIDRRSLRYCFVDRMREVITCKDNRLYPSELERLLTEHPAVSNAAVIGIPHPEMGEAPAALIELRENVQPSQEIRSELESLIATQLASYKQLYGGVHFVASLPRTDQSKIARRKLKELLNDSVD